MNRRRIDSGLVKHLMWKPGQEIPQNLAPKINPQKPILLPNQFNVDDFIKGKLFYESKQADSLEKALEFAGKDGIVLTTPELIEAKIKADKSHKYWNDWMSVHTEENIGEDKDSNAYLVTIHGGGILTPQRIRQAYDKGLNDGSAIYDNQEFYDILEGRTPSGDVIPMFNFEEIKEGALNLPHRFGIRTPYNLVKELESSYRQKDIFIIDPLVISRIANTKLIEPFYEKAKHSDGDLGCYHPFNGRDLKVAQGRLLFVDMAYDGLNGRGGLVNGGRFVGLSG